MAGSVSFLSVCPSPLKHDLGRVADEITANV